MPSKVHEGECVPAAPLTSGGCFPSIFLVFSVCECVCLCVCVGGCHTCVSSL